MIVDDIDKLLGIRQTQLTILPEEAWEPVRGDLWYRSNLRRQAEAHPSPVILLVFGV